MEEPTLEELIDLYGRENKECNTLKKIVKDLNDSLKAQLLNLGEKQHASDNYVAKIVEQNTENFDEDKLLEILESTTYTDEYGCEVLVGSGLNIIKTKKYVDMDALEDAIYNGKIDPSTLVPAKTVKTVVKLNIKEVKK